MKKKTQCCSKLKEVFGIWKNKVVIHDVFPLDAIQTELHYLPSTDKDH